MVIEDCTIPNNGITLNYRLNMENSLLNSFNYLLSCVKSHTNVDINKIKNGLKKPQKQYKYSGLLYAYHEQLKTALIKKNNARIKLLLNSIDNALKVNEHLEITPIFGEVFTETDIDCILMTAGTEYEKNYLTRYDVKRPSDALFSESKRSINKALTVLAEIAPDFFEETQLLISNILICHSKKMHGGTVFNTYGYIYLREFLPEYHWTKYLEGIVHETAHHLLYLLWFTKPILQPGTENEVYFSPLQRGKRPISGVYHAMFVLARICHIFNKISKLAIFQDDIKKIRYDYNNAGNVDTFTDKFNLAYHVVKENAALTTFGQQILDKCYEIAHC